MVCVVNVLDPCFVGRLLVFVLIAIIWLRKGELDSLVLLLFVFHTCLVLVVLWVGLQSAIATFSGHTHFFKTYFIKNSCQCYSKKRGYKYVTLWHLSFL